MQQVVHQNRSDGRWTMELDREPTGNGVPSTAVVPMAVRPGGTRQPTLLFKAVQPQKFLPATHRC